MRFAVLLLLLAGCATTRAAWSDPPWPDSDAVRAAILCAAEQVYGADAARDLARIRVSVRPDLPFRGLNYGGGIPLDSDAKSASASPWRHESVHWLEHRRTGRWTAHPACEREPFLTAERAFSAAYSACRRFEAAP